MELLAGFLLILIAGFFSGSETAIYRANWIRLVTWQNRHLAGAAGALRVLKNRAASIAAMLIGTNLSTVFATILWTRYFADQFGPAYVPIAVTSVVLLTLLFGDYLPKAVAQAIPDRWLRRAELVINASRIAFAPALFVLGRIDRFLLPVRRSRRDFLLTKRDLILALDRHTLDTRLNLARLVERLFRFSTMKVREVAIPIEQVKSVPAAGLNEVLAIISRSGYSRIPVYLTTPDNIIGVIVAKDLLFAPAYRVRKVNRVRADTRPMDVLRTMQRTGEHLAVVTDAADRAIGIVTLEDLLEELVGEIRSEA